jgi:hypothetical protein
MMTWRSRDQRQKSEDFRRKVAEITQKPPK